MHGEFTPLTFLTRNHQWEKLVLLLQDNKMNNKIAQDSTGLDVPPLFTITNNSMIDNVPLDVYISFHPHYKDYRYNGGIDDGQVYFRELKFLNGDHPGKMFLVPPGKYYHQDEQDGDKEYSNIKLGPQHLHIQLD